MKLVIVLLSLGALASAVPLHLNATGSGLGLDLSVFQGDVSQSSFDCLRSSGFEFAIFQAQCSDGSFNQYSINDYHRAKAAGFGGVDFYIFPHLSADPAAQTQATFDKLNSAGVINGNMIWCNVFFFTSNSENGQRIDVEGSWNANTGSNVDFIRAMVNTLEANCGHACVGIYSSASQWIPITGDDHSFSGYPIWYAHYDNSPHMSDFQPFGGWSSPSIKQYKGTTGICSTDIDYNTWNA